MRDTEPTIAPPPDQDPREFALQLAVVLERLDERSTQAVARVEAACVALEREFAAAAHALAVEHGQLAAARHAAAGSRIRLLWTASIALLVGASVAVAGASLAVASAKRELGAIQRNQTLLNAINSADVTLCNGRLCARVEVGDGAEVSGGYRRVLPR